MDKINEEFLALVAVMREKQKAFFRARVNGQNPYDTLRSAKYFEERVDSVLEKYYYSNKTHNGKQA